MKALDLANKRFGRLIVIAPTDERRYGNIVWRCLCDCGAPITVTAADLQKGGTKSCGCLKHSSGENAYRFKHGHSGSGTSTPEYNSWCNMIARCYNSKHPRFADYGGREIKVCECWQGEHGFESFLEDMWPRPKGQTLDRFPDTNGNYEKLNCRWATPHQQNTNRRPRKRKTTTEPSSVH